MGPGVKLEHIAKDLWRVSVIRDTGVSSIVEGETRQIAKLAGRAVRLLHRWDSVPPIDHQQCDSETVPRGSWVRRRYLVYKHTGDPQEITQVLASFASFELAQAFLWSEMDHNNLRVAILDQDTMEAIIDPMPEPVRIKLSSVG
jgi:hypothetical protein